MSLHDPVFQGDHATTQQQSHHHDCYNPAHQYQVARPETPNHDPPELDYRPFTSAAVARKTGSKLGGSAASAEVSSARALSPSPISYTGTLVEVILASNWGDPSYIGLTGISLLEADSRQPVALRPDQLTLSVPLEDGSVRESRVPELIDGINLTTDSSHMWVWSMPRSPFHRVPSLIFKLDTPTSLWGLRVWNYNLSTEESYTGVSWVWRVAIMG